jgi:hypothetical protein
MVINFNRFSARKADRPTPSDTDDAVSTATPKAGTTPTDIDEEMKEIMHRFKFQPKNADAAKKVAVVHTHLLSKIKEAFKDDVIIYDNKGKVIKKIDPINWNPVIHQSHFHIHASQGTTTRKSKYIIIHCIRTLQSLATICTYNMIHSLLKQHSCYMKEHHWNESVWDITQASYLIGINPKHYTPDTANQIVLNMMEKKSPGKCPPLCMIYTSLRISLDDCNVSSKVYTIEYERKNAKDIIQKLKDKFAGYTQLLMAKLRFTHPQSFTNALKMQNQIMKDTFILPLVNVTRDEMFYLQPLLEQLPGVTTTFLTRLTPISGRYNILISAGKFKEVKGNIVKNFSDLYNKVPADARQNPDALQYMGPPRIKVAADSNADESSGTISFLTTSAASFASFDMLTTDDAFETFTPVT